jgi:outer membrane biosynthesis protein TonB
MADNFESRKNVKASGYTALVCALVLCVLLFVKWTLPTIPPPPDEEGIEVNLGNSNFGSGKDQPFLPGKPSPVDKQAYTPPKQVKAPVEDVKDFETNDKDPDAPVIKKPPITKPNATKVPDKEIIKSKPVRNPKPAIEPPAPAPPRPKAVFRGVNGTGTGGNEADNYKKGGSEGIAGGTGDQGASGGNPQSDNYKGGGTGNSGVAKLRGLTGRNIIRRPTFEDDFNENAKVAVDIKIDEAGNVIEAEYQPRGSSTSDGNLKAIAIRKAKQVKFNPGSDESTGTLQFNFKLKS